QHSSQQCTDNFGQVVCTCFLGYRFDQARHRSHKSPYCLDINECEQPGTSMCQHECVNTVGSFLCRCGGGYILAPDRSTGTSDTLMSAGTCSFTCQDFSNMKSSLLQLKLKLGNIQSPNQMPGLATSSNKPSVGRAGKDPHPAGLPGATGKKGEPGEKGHPGLQGPRGDMGPIGPEPDLKHIKRGRRGPVGPPGAPGRDGLKVCRLLLHLQGPPGSFDFLLLMMADIRNDIIELQQKVLGGRRGISLETHPHSSGEMEFGEWGSPEHLSKCSLDKNLKNV
uniref:EGF-like calcium-binding domain-containing protein n=1 Tax=Takifugu rubripes TaxID=31033 RepID=A0A674PC64_TAKRU